MVEYKIATTNYYCFFRLRLIPYYYFFFTQLEKSWITTNIEPISNPQPLSTPLKYIVSYELLFFLLFL